MTNDKLKTAIVIGATGLVGSHLTKKLLQDPRYKSVKIFVRRSAGMSNPKLDEHIVDFDLIEKWENLIVGDELFSTLGTTIKKAGSKEEQYKVDFTYQFEIAKAAAENEVNKYLLVSSASANRFSANFYLRMKGQLEYNISQIPFEQIIIFQPSILVGERNEKRSGELLGTKVIEFLSKRLQKIKKYRPIEADILADALINAANDSSFEKITIYKLDEIFQVAQ